MIGHLFPWLYSRRPLPGPGSGNIAYLNLALQEQTPIGAGIANARQFIFTTPLTYQPHLIGIQGLGGLVSGTFNTGGPLINVSAPQ